MSTKKLAKELGLLRKRSQSSGQKKSLISNQIFAYLIVIDFESTCWRERNSYGQEIIEFPAVLLNTSTGEVSSEFHMYVQPQEHPVLSEFCTELTGITQTQVEAGVPLHICLARFSRWLQTLQFQNGVVFPNEQRGSITSTSQQPAAFLTWSDWDLGVCLQYECKRKQIHKPNVLSSWIDLRATYRQFYNRKPKGLNGALQDLGIQFSGREHSGLDDARNTAQLAVRMMRDGCVMKVTRSQEKAPLMTKPQVYANNKKEERCSDTEKKEVFVTLNTCTSNTTPKSCLLKSSSKNTKEKTNSNQEAQGVQSLISPRTLLNGIQTPLLGSSASKLVKGKTVTNLFSPILINNFSLNNRSSNTTTLVQCPLTAGCLSYLPNPNQTSDLESDPEHTRYEEGTEFFVELEEGCNSYDNVVLGRDDVVIDLYKENGRFDTENSSDCEEGRSSWLMPQMSYNNNNNNMRKVPSVQDNSETQMTVYGSTKISHSSTFAPLNETLMRTHVPLPDTSFAVPKAVTWNSKSVVSRSNLHKDVAKESVQIQDYSKAPCDGSKSILSSLIKSGVSERTNDSFAIPKSVIIKHHHSTGTCSKEPKLNAKKSFTVYTDQTSTSAANPSSNVSLTTSILSSLCTNHSSMLSTSRGGMSKITSPLCACGRRAKRQTVANGGPNHGRGFYCCPVRRSGSGNKVQKGCQFFKWESALIKTHSPFNPATSMSLCLNSGLHLCPPQSKSRKSY